MSNTHYMAPRVSMVDNSDYEPLKLDEISYQKKRQTNNDADSRVSSLLIKKTTSQGVTPNLNFD